MMPYTAIEYTPGDSKPIVKDPVTKAADIREKFEVDRDRIIHSAGFRRLQRKTQLFAPDQSDHFRTRLTHSLEVAQIAKGLALVLGANTNLCEAAAFGHDIGHPPFGHRGEEVLQKLMKNCGGFEANAQNLRIVGNLEEKFPVPIGLNLSRGVLDAMCKYKTPYAPGLEKRFHYLDDPLAEWIKSVGDEDLSFECDIVNLADDIAYAVHDLEDGLHAGLISPARAVHLERDILEHSLADDERVDADDVYWAIEQIEHVQNPESPMTQAVAAKQKTSELIHEFIHGIERIERPELSALGTPRYFYGARPSDEVSRKLASLKALSFTLLISDHRVHTLEARAERILRDLWRYFRQEKALNAYPDEFRQKFKEAPDYESRARIACDYISSMTDERAQRLHRRLFSGEWSALLEL